MSTEEAREALDQQIECAARAWRKAQPHSWTPASEDDPVAQVIIALRSIAALLPEQPTPAPEPEWTPQPGEPLAWLWRDEDSVHVSTQPPGPGDWQSRLGPNGSVTPLFASVEPATPTGGTVDEEPGVDAAEMNRRIVADLTSLIEQAMPDDVPAWRERYSKRIALAIFGHGYRPATPDPTPQPAGPTGGTVDEARHPAPAEVVSSGNAAGFPLVQGECPACGSRSLFLGAGGYVTCSRLDCREPDAPTSALVRPATPATPTGGTVNEEPGVGAVVRDVDGTRWEHRGNGWHANCEHGCDKPGFTWRDVHEAGGSPLTLVRPATPDPTPQPADPAPEGEVGRLARDRYDRAHATRDELQPWDKASAHVQAEYIRDASVWREVFHAHGWRHVGDGQVVVERDDLRAVMHASNGDVPLGIFPRFHAALDAGGAG